jgi:PAS domain S-box-containing protein
MRSDEKVNILMVDDQPGKLLTYEAILSDLGENLIQATSARQALEVLLRHDIAVVLMDVSMPELDGFELADLIRQHPRFQKMAIIFISGVHLSEADTITGYQRGAVDYISVPVVPEVLRAKISVFVELHRKTRLLERLNNQLEQRVEERTEALRQSEQQFRSLVNSIPQLAWMAHADGAAFWYNQRWCDFAGAALEQLQQTGWAYLWHPEHASRIRAGIRKAIGLRKPWEDTFPLRCEDGQYRWFLSRAVPILSAQGEVARWFGTATDVTERIEAEERIRLLNRQLEQRVGELETVMQVLPVGIAISSDPTLDAVITNSAFRQIFEMDAQSRPSIFSENALKDDPTPVPVSFIRKSIDAKCFVSNEEMQIAASDGSVRHILASARPLLEEHGKIRGAVGVFFDVSQRKRLEDTLRERAELLELASEAIMVHDQTGVIRYWNSGAESFYGWPRSEALGKNIHTLLQTKPPIPQHEVNQVLQNLGAWQGKLLQYTRDGREVIVASRMALDRETNVILEISRDITGEIQAEEALRQAEKLAAMGRMAGIIAHEINNPLEAITNTFYLLRNHPSLDSEARYYASLAEQELERASHITRQTLSFYRESNHPIPVFLPDLLNSVLELQQRSFDLLHITLDRRFASTQKIFGFPVELRQVFLNLVSNAVQAMPEAGCLRVRCAEGMDRASQRRGVVVAITDTGFGIRHEDIEKLFQPFFTTKSTKGTGLGLWISKGIVQKYDGSISFRSLRFRGHNYTCFRVFLPLGSATHSAATHRSELASMEIDSVSASTAGAYAGQSQQAESAG